MFETSLERRVASWKRHIIEPQFNYSSTGPIYPRQQCQSLSPEPHRGLPIFQSLIIFILDIEGLLAINWLLDVFYFIIIMELRLIFIVLRLSQSPICISFSSLVLHLLNISLDLPGPNLFYLKVFLI